MSLHIIHRCFFPPFLFFGETPEKETNKEDPNKQNKPVQWNDEGFGLLRMLEVMSITFHSQWQVSMFAMIFPSTAGCVTVLQQGLLYVPRKYHKNWRMKLAFYAPFGVI